MRGQLCLELFNSFLYFTLGIVNWMNIFTLLFKLTIRLLDLLPNLLNLCKFVLLFVIIVLELTE